MSLPVESETADSSLNDSHITYNVSQHVTFKAVEALILLSIT